jgi:hypothetical protein
MTRNWFIAHSRIQGVGVFAKKNFVMGEPIEVVMRQKPQGGWYITPEFGSRVNHSKKYRNTKLKLLKDNQYWLIATEPIQKNSELVADYNEASNPPMIRRVDFPVHEP